MIKIITNRKLWIITCLLGIIRVNSKSPLQVQSVENNILLLNPYATVQPDDVVLDEYISILKDEVPTSHYDGIVALSNRRQMILDADVDAFLTNSLVDNPKLDRPRKILSIVLHNVGYRFILKEQLKRVYNAM